MDDAEANILASLGRVRLCDLAGADGLPSDGYNVCVSAPVAGAVLGGHRRAVSGRRRPARCISNTWCVLLLASRAIAACVLLLPLVPSLQAPAAGGDGSGRGEAFLAKV
ncbi:Os09g0283250 [Oryza sativa Japonica Group]|uniref:Os09g0283250 protein n=1 Tax=Oryza sativa subsp. japonica TaxID=39947 RepID=A0A0P0XJP5_ORYSJ|nr:Os09g0283250 [Oryza sativa Japonica Group]